MICEMGIVYQQLLVANPVGVNAGIKLLLEQKFIFLLNFKQKQNRNLDLPLFKSKTSVKISSGNPSTSSLAIAGSTSFIVGLMLGTSGNPARFLAIAALTPVLSCNKINFCNIFLLEPPASEWGLTHQQLDI